MQKRIKNYLGRNFSKKRISDPLSTQGRSALMSRIRSKNTKFELAFVSELKKCTHIKFKTNVLSLQGKPDIVFPKQKVCVFLDSDFWHGWQYPRWKHLLKDDFWRSKIEANRKRDRKNTKFLRRWGWNVFRFWEHNIKKDIRKSVIKITDGLNGGVST